MCRSIKVLHNFEPPVTDEEIRAAAVQFVRKITAMHHPAARNRDAFDRAVEEIHASARRLLDTLPTHDPKRDRALEAARAKERAAKRFAPAGGS